MIAQHAVTRPPADKVLRPAPAQVPGDLVEDDAAIGRNAIEIRLPAATTSLSYVVNADVIGGGAGGIPVTRLGFLQAVRNSGIPVCVVRPTTQEPDFKNGQMDDSLFFPRPDDRSLAKNPNVRFLNPDFSSPMAHRDIHGSRPYVYSDHNTPGGVQKIEQAALKVPYWMYQSYYANHASGVMWPLLHGMVVDISADPSQPDIVYPIPYSQSAVLASWEVAYRVADQLLTPGVTGSCVDEGGQPRKGAVVCVDDFHLDSMVPFALRDLYERRFAELDPKGELRPTIIRFRHTPEFPLGAYMEWVTEGQTWPYKSHPKTPPCGLSTEPRLREFMIGYLSGTFASDLAGCQSPRDVGILLNMADHFKDGDGGVRFSVDQERGVVTVHRSVDGVQMPDHFCRVVAAPVSVIKREIRARITDNIKGLSNVNERLDDCGMLGIPVLGSVQRADFTKALPEQVMGFRRFLEKNYHLAGRVGFVLVAKATRKDVPTNVYERQIEYTSQLVDELNKEWGPRAGNNSKWKPICLILGDGLPPAEVCALYSRELTIGAVALSRKDGQVLVGHEFHAAKTGDQFGALIVSDGCGASFTLGANGAIVVQDYCNPEEISAAMQRVFDSYFDDRRELVEGHRAASQFLDGYSATQWSVGLVDAAVAFRDSQNTPGGFEQMMARIRPNDLMPRPYRQEDNSIVSS
jgi:trehalose-6-phosphate synthase